MRIQITTTLFPTKRIYSWAKYWTIAGHHVDIFAQKQTAQETFPNPGFQLHPFPDVVEDLPLSDILISTGHQQCHELGCGAIQKERTSKWIADVGIEDFVKPRLPFNTLSQWMQRRYARKLFKNCHHLIASSHKAASHLQILSHHPKATTIPNGFDPFPLKNSPATPFYPEDGKFRLLYPTPAKSLRSLSLLFSALATLAADPFLKHLMQRFECVILGTHNKEVQKLAEEYQIDTWIRWHDPLPKLKLMKALRDAHAILYTADGGEDEIPDLFFEVLASRTKVVLIGKEGQLPPHERLLMQSGCCQLLPHHKGVHNFLREKLANISKEIAPNPARFLDAYSRKTLAFKLLSLMT